MPKWFFLAIALLLSIALPARADVLWVGDSPACDGGANTFSTLASAVLTAAFRAGNDEIRLTDTVTYTGSANRLDLVDYDPSSIGGLTIAGGYNDCFGTQSGRSRIGDTVGPLVRVATSSRPVSEVTLENLEIAGGTSLRGLDVSGGAVVFLRNTVIRDNVAGVIVSGGAFVDIDADSRILSHFSVTAQFGASIRCSGSNSEVVVRGELNFARADFGGHIHISSGCLVELEQGARVIDGLAITGGGIYVDNGGVLLASGGASRVLIDDNGAENGGGLYLNGTGRAVLFNTLIRNNWSSSQGSAIYAIGGGVSGTPQLVMDRVADCPFLISCSEIEGNRGEFSTIYARDSRIEIQRTLFDRNVMTPDGLVTASGSIGLVDASAFINRVGFIGNQTYSTISSLASETVVRHVTAVDNVYPDGVQDIFDLSVRNSGEPFEVYNSLFMDTRGIDGPPGFEFTGLCNLVADPFNWPAGSTDVGTAEFINAAGGDLRQLPSSPGVDMCNAQPGAPANDRDLEFQLAPVNEFTNPQGSPGQSGGLWDAGVDEVYSTIGDDEFTLTVARGGSGTGFVNSSPPGINCGSDCSETYFQGQVVTLSALPNPGSTFAGWSVCPLPNGSQCLIALDEDTTITALFERDEFDITVERTGAGEGLVQSLPLGITCGSDCSETYPLDTLLTLTASPFTGSVFAGWSGCPLTNGLECFNTVDSDRTITARFEPDEFTLNVVRGGAGAGRITSSPAGIDCGSDCSELYANGTLVRLSALPEGGSTFAGWVACPLLDGDDCLVAMDGDRSITANFEIEQRQLTVVQSGTGSGRVTSTPAGIDCGTECSAMYEPGASVVLVATADPDQLFDEWLDCPSPAGNQCQITMDADRVVTARFRNADELFADGFEVP
jgi:hypothetical protein